MRFYTVLLANTLQSHSRWTPNSPIAASSIHHHRELGNSLSHLQNHITIDPVAALRQDSPSSRSSFPSKSAVSRLTEESLYTTIRYIGSISRWNHFYLEAMVSRPDHQVSVPSLQSALLRHEIRACNLSAHEVVKLDGR